MASGDVDGVLGGEPVAGPALGVSEIAVGGESDNLAVVFGDKHRVPSLLLLCEPSRPFLGAVGLFSPLVGGGQQEGVGDLGDGDHVRLLGWPDLHDRHSSILRP
jgi:hypothetical protein